MSDDDDRERRREEEEEDESDREITFKAPSTYNLRGRQVERWQTDKDVRSRASQRDRNNSPRRTTSEPRTVGFRVPDPQWSEHVRSEADKILRALRGEALHDSQMTSTKAAMNTDTTGQSAQTTQDDDCSTQRQTLYDDGCIPLTPSSPPSYGFDPESEAACNMIANLVRLVDQGNQRSVPSRVISDTVIGLKKFSGSASDRDSVETWLEEFNRYVEFRGLPNTEKLQLFKILMRDGAADWLSTLAKDKTASWDELIKEFKATYFSSPELKWAKTRDLFHEPMKETERVDDFVIRIRKSAKRLNLGEEVLHYAILNGLRPAIRNQVLAKGVQSLEETLRIARIAECSVQTDPVQALLMEALKSNKETAQTQSRAINVLAEQIQTLLNTSEVCTMGRGNTGEMATSRNTLRYPRTNNNNTGPTQPVRVHERRTPRPTPQRVQRENYGRQQQQISQRGAVPNRNTNEYRATGPSTAIGVACTNCGRSHDRGQCPAYGQTCSFCGRLGHFARWCRSVRRA